MDPESAKPAKLFCICVLVCWTNTMSGRPHQSKCTRHLFLSRVYTLHSEFHSPFWSVLSSKSGKTNSLNVKLWAFAGLVLGTVWAKTFRLWIMIPSAGFYLLIQIFRILAYFEYHRKVRSDERNVYFLLLTVSCLSIISHCFLFPYFSVYFCCCCCLIQVTKSCLCLLSQTWPGRVTPETAAVWQGWEGAQAGPRKWGTRWLWN